MITFFVPGMPVAKGSAKSFYNAKAHKIVTMQDNREKQKPWASMISYCAQEAGCKMSLSPIILSLDFRMPRPKSHYGTGKNAATLKPSAPHLHTSTPDIDKLIRCTMDALTGIAWKDDRQVAWLHHVSKNYNEIPGVEITIDEA